jgi:hypothetical protein
MKKKVTSEPKGQRDVAKKEPPKPVRPTSRKKAKSRVKGLAAFPPAAFVRRHLNTAGVRAREESVHARRGTEELKQKWDSLTANQKGNRLKELRPKFPSNRALAKAVGKTEGRIRQLIKVAKASKRSSEQPPSVEAEARTSSRHPGLAPVASENDGLTPQAEHGVFEMHKGATEVSDPTATTKTFRDDAPAGPETTQAAPAKVEIEPKQVAGAGPEGDVAGKTVLAASATNYAIKDLKVGGNVLFSWIRANVKSREWDEAIEDFKTAYWISKSSYQEEKLQLGNIPDGLTPDEVVRLCKTTSIERELENIPRDARRKWFACWTSVLLPDSGVRRDAVVYAGKLLKVRGGRWDYLTNTAYLNRPTPCLRSNNLPLPDLLEKLTHYLNMRVLVAVERIGEVEVTEALKYAAATLREGSPPGLD